MTDLFGDNIDPAQAAPAFVWTKEQLDVIGAQERRVKVRAGAGTGKSRTLRGIAEANPTKKFLYVVFNTALKHEAESVFPDNVETRTFHSLAWHIALKLFGSQDVARKKIGQPRPLDIAQVFEVQPETASVALATISAWLCSADEAIEERHIPEDADLAKVDVALMVQFARDVWKCMLDKRRMDVLMPPDGYLKLFQLRKQILTEKKSRLPFDMIMFDEYQDANACMLDIVQRQPGYLRYVGDPYQSIYAFRGAVNADLHVQFDAEYPLLQSFRFGQPIADQANQLLAYFKPDHKPLVGAGKFQSESKVVDQTKTFAVISRTNAALFDQAVQLLNRDVPYCFVGGIEKYRFDILMNTYYLYAGMRDHINDPYINRFKSFEHLLEVGTETEDFELIFLHKIVALHRDEIPHLIKQIKDRSVRVLEKDLDSFTGIFFTTGHKCKGLQFRQVLITDDFAELTDAIGEPLDPLDVDPQEINLLYVVMTRAMETLQMPDSYMEFIIALMDFDPEQRTIEPQYTYRREEVTPAVPQPVAPQKPPMITARPKAPNPEQDAEQAERVPPTPGLVNHEIQQPLIAVRSDIANVPSTADLQEAPQGEPSPAKKQHAAQYMPRPMVQSQDNQTYAISPPIASEPDDVPSWMNEGPGYDDMLYMTDRDMASEEKASEHILGGNEAAAAYRQASGGDVEGQDEPVAVQTQSPMVQQPVSSPSERAATSSSDSESASADAAAAPIASPKLGNGAVVPFRPRLIPAGAGQDKAEAKASKLEWKDGEPPAFMFTAEFDDKAVPLDLAAEGAGFLRSARPV